VYNKVQFERQSYSNGLDENQADSVFYILYYDIRSSN